MRLRMLLAGLLMLLPAPALADITAHYSAGEKDKVTVEADDGGSVRASFGDKFAFIHRDGVDYVLVADNAGGFAVGRLADVFELISGQLKGRVATEATIELRQGGEEAVADFAGTIWFLGPKEVPGQSNNQALDFLISGDTRLAPIGAFFRRLFGIGAPMLGTMFGGGEGNFASLADTLFARGAPIRFGPMLKLESVDTADVPLSRFDLPGPVLEPIEFLEAVTPSQSSAGLPNLP